MLESFISFQDSPIGILSLCFCKLLTFRFPFPRLIHTGPSLQPLTLDLVTYIQIKLKAKAFEIDMLFLTLTAPLIFSSTESDSHEWRQTMEKKEFSLGHLISVLSTSTYS